MALPISRLIRVSTSDKVGFLGTSESIGSSRRAARVDCSLAFLTLLLLYPPTSSSPLELDSMTVSISRIGCLSRVDKSGGFGLRFAVTVFVLGSGLCGAGQNLRIECKRLKWAFYVVRSITRMGFILSI